MALSGPEKAVLLLLSLDEAAAAPIVAELDDADVRKLREAASAMRAVPANSLDDVYKEFLERSTVAVAVPRGGLSYLHRVASKAFGAAKSEQLFAGQAPVSALQRIGDGDPIDVALLLEREHPQLVAAILSQIDPTKAAKIIEAMPPERQGLLVSRLGSLSEIPAGLLEGVATALADELPTRKPESTTTIDGVSRAAGVLRKLNKELAADLLGRMGDEYPEITAEIRRAMYAFEDLKSLDARAMRLLLKEIPSDRLALALKTASEETKQKILSSMSSRAADLLKDDLEAMGGVRLSEVEAAQREIVEAALKLEAEGTIQLGEDNDVV